MVSPPPDIIKLNVDAAYNNCEACMLVVLVITLVKILQVWSKRIFSSNPIFAEVVALLWTLEISLDMKYLNIVV